MDDLAVWLRAQLDADALWATEASRRYGGAAQEGGVHWQWVEPETDTPVAPDPSRDEHLTDNSGNFRFSLRSVEEFPREHVGPLPLFALSSAEEVPVAVAGHIVAHDPARVLREIDAKRRILDDVLPTMRADELRIAGEWGVGSDPVREASDDLLSLLALPYADRPGFREEWRP